MRNPYERSILTGLITVFFCVGCSKSTKEISSRSLAGTGATGDGKTERAMANVPRDEAPASKKTLPKPELPPAEPKTPWEVVLKTEEAIMLNAPRKLFALKATLASAPWATPGTTEPEAGQDDNLLTAWKCRPDEKKGPCALSLVFPKPATVCKVRLFAAAALPKAKSRDEAAIRRMRLISDHGRADVTLLKRRNYQHIDIPGCVETRTLSLEPLGDETPMADKQFYIAEVEALGTAGTAREPLSISGRFFYVRAEDFFWGPAPSPDGNYAGNETETAWVEMTDINGMAHAQRLLKGHRWSLFGDNRYLIVENVSAGSCPGAEYHEAARFGVFDLQTRVLYALGGSPDFEGRVFFDEKKPLLVYTAADFSGEEGETLIFDLSTANGTATKRKAEHFDAYMKFLDDKKKEGLLEFPRTAVPGRATAAPEEKPLSKTFLLKLKSRLLVYDDAKEEERPLIEDAEAYYAQSAYLFARGFILVGGSLCDSPAAVISLSTNGAVLDVLMEAEYRPRIENGIAHWGMLPDYSVSNAAVIFFDDETPIINLDRSGGDTGDIYRVNESGKFELILPNALFQLGAPSDCRCNA